MPEPSNWQCHLHLTNDPRAPHIACRTLRTALLGHAHTPEPADTAELLTSELVSSSGNGHDGVRWCARCTASTPARAGFTARRIHGVEVTA